MSVGVRVGGPARRPAPTGSVATQGGARERNAPERVAPERVAPRESVR